MSSELERPTRPRRPQLIALLAAALVGLSAVAAIGLGTRSDDRAVASSGSGPYRGSEPPAEFELPPFELKSYRGGRVASEMLAGDIVLLTILDAQCTDVCPILASVVAGTIDRLTEAERRQVRAIGITGDPKEDTPAAVRQFLSARRAIGRLDYLLGSEAQLRHSGPRCRFCPLSTAARTASTPRRFASTTEAESGSRRCMPAPT